MHTALDGHRVAVTSETLNLSRPATSTVTAVVENSRQEFTAGTRAFGDSYAALSRVSLDEEYSFQQGRLRVGVGFGLTGAVCVAVWGKDRSSIVTHLYGDATAEDAVALFDRFIVGETTIGQPTLVPRDPATTPFIDAPTVAKELPDLGLLLIARLTPMQARSLPTWAGTPVRGGELFVGDVGTPRMRFVLVHRNAVTTVMPRHSLLSDLDRILSDLGALDISWLSQ